MPFLARRQLTRKINANQEEKSESEAAYKMPRQGDAKRSDPFSIFPFRH